MHFKPWDLSRKKHLEILIEKDVLNVLRDALGVELWPFYCKPKNFGPNVIYYVFAEVIMVPLCVFMFPPCSLHVPQPPSLF